VSDGFKGGTDVDIGLG